MSNETYYKSLGKKLINAYAKKCHLEAIKTTNSNPLKKLSKLNPKDKHFLLKVADLAYTTGKHKTPSELDKALESIDLAKIYEGVDKRESENSKHENESKLKYEDFIVLEVLNYFKHDFFKWVNKPECPQCNQNSDNMIPIGASGPPSNNPDEISNIENYKCKSCGIAVDFLRYNNPVKLLETKQGRCGEWVNCFILILQALLGTETQIRYVWNNEDHVWCEYYSSSLQRWIHLDPCEGVFDEPNLYCENWGKKMSWCIGFGETYIMDLSNKYITKPDKQINKLESVSNLRNVEKFIDILNRGKLVKFYQGLKFMNLDDDEALTRIYNQVIVIRNIEEKSNQNEIVKANTTEIPKGRQTGDAEWTKSRGEDGK